MPHVDVGVPLEYVEQGSGDPVVFVHGVLGDYRVWRNQMEPFAQRYRVIAYSRRNHFPNAWSDYPSNYSLELERDDLAGLIQGLGLSTVSLVGSSLGGTIAALLALDKPGMVRKLVLNDPALRSLVASDPTAASSNDMSQKVMASTKASIAAGKLEEGARTFTDYQLGEGTFDRLPSPMRAVLVQNARPLSAELTDTPQPFTCQDANRIDVPTLVISGDRTASFYQLVAQRLVQCLPKNSQKIVPGASHAPYRQNPQAFNELILNFLGGI